MRLIQYRTETGNRAVGLLSDEDPPVRLDGVTSLYDLAMLALREGSALSDAAAARAGAVIDLDAILAEGRLLAPIDHPDPAHLHLTGTGLTHLGSAEGRDQMHKAAAERHDRIRCGCS